MGGTGWRPGQETAGLGQTATSGNGRRIAFTAATALFAVGAFGGLLGFSVIIGWFDNSDGGIHRVHDIGFGVLYGIILSAACLAMIRRPERKASAFFQVLVTVVAGLIAALASADGRYLFFPIIVAASAAILFALHPARADLFRPALRPSGWPRSPWPARSRSSGSA